MSLRPRRLFTRWGAVLLAFLLCAVAFGQGTWSLGSYTLLSGTSSPPLRVSQASAGGLGSYDFVSSVGGVAFAGIARAGTGSDARVELRYLADASDGQRLQVTMGGRTVRAELPDWMLVPIARFAGSPYDSCVSLFGPRTTDTQYDIVYHEVFQNTLIGLRLLQADMLLFDLSETWRLPKFGGVTILGSGETEPRLMNGRSVERIQSVLANGRFQSWVMTDRGEDVVFSDEGGTLRLSGEPYYYFWTSDFDAYQTRHNELARQANAARTGAERKRIVDEANRLRPVVQEVTNLTQALRTVRPALRDFNPSVYDAATATMRYAAFFRYASRQNPAAWRAFLTQLNGITPKPSISTPTAWAR